MHALLLVLAILAFHLLTFREGHSWGGDFAMYIHHAQNLAGGVAYADTGYLYNSAAPELGPPHYPPVFPALLAPVLGIAGFQLSALKAVVALLFAGFLLAVDWALRDSLTRNWRLLALGILGLSPIFWDFTDYVGSEALFGLLLYLCFGSIRDLGERSGLASWRGPALGIALALLIGTRSVGLVAIPAILAAELWGARRVRGPIALALGIALCLWLAETLLLGAGSGYLDQLRVTPRGIAANLLGYGVALHSFWDAGSSQPATASATLAFTGFALLGFVQRLRRGPDVRDFFFVVYLTTIVIWPDNQGVRFLIPVLPLYLLYAFEGVTAALPSPSSQRMAQLAAALLAAACFSAGYASRDWDRIPQGVAKLESAELFAWVRDQTAPDAAFVFFKPRVLSLYTGRPAGVLHEGTDASRWEFIESVDARYLVESGADPASVRRFAASNADRLEPVWRNADFAVLRVRRAR